MPLSSWNGGVFTLGCVPAECSAAPSGGPETDLQARTQGCGHSFEQVESGIVIGILQTGHCGLAESRPACQLGLGQPGTLARPAQCKLHRELRRNGDIERPGTTLRPNCLWFGRRLARHEMCLQPPDESFGRALANVLAWIGEGLAARTPGKIGQSLSSPLRDDGRVVDTNYLSLMPA